MSERVEPSMSSYAPPVPGRPAESEYAPYYGKYVRLVPDGHIIGTLTRQIGETVAMLRGVPEERGGHRYEPGKWSIKEAVGHMADAERIFSYRALRIARGDRTPIPGFEQDDYVRLANSDARRLEDLIDELAQVRRATIALLRGFDDAAWTRTGTASDNPVSVRALAYIIAGHELHHAEIFRTRYL